MLGERMLERCTDPALMESMCGVEVSLRKMDVVVAALFSPCTPPAQIGERESHVTIGVIPNALEQTVWKI
jgi:hypothetical protein